MKKYLAWALLIIIGFPISAQVQSGISIHVFPVTGKGSGPDDIAFITNLLINDVTSRNHTLVKSPHKADYLLIGTIDLYSETTERDFDDWGYEFIPASYIFRLKLQNTYTNVVEIEQDLVYYNLDDVEKLFPYLMYDIFYHPFARIKDNRSWQNNWLYFGINAFWTPRLYIGTEQASHLINFGGGLSLEWHFLPFMTVESGAEFVSDWVSVSDGTDVDFRDLLIEIPILLKLVFKPSEYFTLEPYGGVHYNLSLLDITIPPMFSWTGGFKLNVKTPRASIIYLDPRFSMDMGDSFLNTTSNIPLKQYKRYIMHFGIGCKFGFFPKRR